MTSPMKRMLFFLLVSFILPAVSAKASDEAKSTKEVSYLRDIWPILQRRCQGCHQPSVKQANLDLTHYDRFREGGKSGRAFVAGDPDKSLVLTLISGKREP